MKLSKTEAIEEAMLYIEAINVLHRARPVQANQELIDALRDQIELIVGVSFLNDITFKLQLKRIRTPEPQITITP
jgi:hypothetical protein